MLKNAKKTTATTKTNAKNTTKSTAKTTIKAVSTKSVAKSTLKKSATKTSTVKSTSKGLINSKDLMDNAQSAQIEASVLLSHAQFLNKAADSKSDKEKVIALDANLKLWVEIETNLKSSTNLLPKEVKANLLNLSKFVERLTLSKGLKMTKKDYDCLVNINMQISEGLLESVKSQMAREEALSLLKCAIDLSNAHEKGNEKAFATALDNNLKLWVYIKTVAQDKQNPLPKQTKSNLIKLAEYVSGKTMEMGKNLKKINEKVLDSMILTNLQISEGLMTYEQVKAK